MNESINLTNAKNFNMFGPQIYSTLNLLEAR